MLSSLSSTAHNNAARCLHFERGQCRHGSSCRFLHITETSTSHHQDESVNSQDPPLAERPTSKTSVKPCRYFLRTGWCGFGSNCRFSHSKLSADENCSHEEDSGTDIKPEDGASLACSAQNETQPQPQKESSRRKLCWYFKRGRCQFGERCKQLHVVADGTDLSGEQDVTKQQPRKYGRDTESGWHRRTTQQKQGAKADKGEQNVMAQADKEVENMTAQADKEADNVAAQADEGAKNMAVERGGAADQLETLRATELRQLCRRYPKASIRESEDGSTAATFVFEPTDPDWVRKVQALLSLLVTL